MKYTYYFDWYSMCYDDIGGNDINIGDKVLVYSKENIITGNEWYGIRKDFAETGYPGNMDASEREFHGWRGTTNDIRVCAHGVYRVASVEEIKKKNRWGWTERYLKVVLDRKDISEV